MNNLIGFIVSVIYIASILVISMFLSKKGEEISRKFVHIMLSNIWFIYLFFIDSLVVACILPARFVLINILSYKFKLIKSMERENNDGFGTIYYAISILIISAFSYYLNIPMIGTLGVLVMGYGDGFAAIIGKGVNSPKYRIGNTTKSLAGSLTMLIVSMIISCIVLNLLGAEYFVLKAICISVLATILEAISIKGLDNISVPVILTALVYLMV